MCDLTMKGGMEIRLTQSDLAKETILLDPERGRSHRIPLHSACTPIAVLRPRRGGGDSMGERLIT